MSKARLVVDITETKQGYKMECQVRKESGGTVSGGIALALAEHLPALVEHAKTLIKQQDEKEKQHASKH